ncbi:MAG: glycosyltransferase [Roseburia sp.]|nr:glycosyltransferase [Roseburia sp.]
MAREFVENLVSVITPVYNAEKYIGKTIESILSQTYQDIELILVDDCSTDNSEKIIKKYCKKNSNIVYFKQKTNRGAAVARNTALKIAKGRYVAFLDSDDIWYPEKTKKQLELMLEKESPFSYTAIEMINDQGNLVKSKRNVRTSIDYKYLLHNTMIATSSVIIDRNVLGDFQMPLRRGGQDYATWLMLLREGIIARGINEALVQYRLSNNSLSSNKFKSIQQVWQIQTENESISRPKAVLNVFCFGVNALKKYLI